MEDAIKKVAGIVTGDISGTESELLSGLTKCAVEICKVAIMALRGELRAKAINLAIAICDYEDELSKAISKD